MDREEIILGLIEEQDKTLKDLIKELSDLRGRLASLPSVESDHDNFPIEAPIEGHSFQIRTNRNVADSIQYVSDLEEKTNSKRSYRVSAVHHLGNTSVLDIYSSEPSINEEDIFWLGYLSALDK